MAAENLPVRPVTYVCPCPSSMHHKTRSIVHPDGWLEQCTCGEQWVVWSVTARRCP